MLTISEVSKAYGPQTLFENVSLQINRSDRIGLIGPNGAGKSTLFSLILGEEEPDSGSVARERNIVVGHLPQESSPAGDSTVLDTALSAVQDEHGIASYEMEPKAKRILSGLSFREKDFTRPLREMSGGWVMRAHLAKLLVQEPDILMLDEPTNHLDLESLQWFQSYLEEYSGGILMISHDRNFLNALTTHIVEIRQRKLFRYRGNYDNSVEQRAAAEAQQLAAYKNQQREIAQLMEFVQRFRAKASKAAQAQSKLKQIERMEKIEAPVNESKKISFHFPQPQRGGLRSIKLEDVHYSYGTNSIYRGINFEAERGQRIVLVGPNGAGKSTLLKLLAGVLPVQSGLRELGHNTKSGYYSQYRVDMLKPERKVLEEALDTPQSVTEESVRTLLGCFLFRGDDVFKRVSVLSGGEKSRLALVKLLLDPPNLLLMDEPTTHLDMASIDALIEALKQFSGTLIFISHDVYFIRELCTHVVRVENGHLAHFPSGWQYYLDKMAAIAPLPASPVVAQRPPRTKEQKRLEAEERQARSRERKEHEQLVSRLEVEIQKLEARQKELHTELESPASYEKPGRAMELNRECVEVDARLKELSKEWEEAARKVEETKSPA